MMVKAASLFHRYALGWILGALFLLTWIGQWLTHTGTTMDFLNATLENWQSEFLQLATFVVLAAYAIYQGSPQSKDGAEKMQADIDALRNQATRIERAIARLEEQNVNTLGK